MKGREINSHNIAFMPINVIIQITKFKYSINNSVVAKSIKVENVFLEIIEHEFKITATLDCSSINNVLNYQLNSVRNRDLYLKLTDNNAKTLGLGPGN